MKRVFILLLTLIINVMFGIGFSVKTYALYHDKSGTVWWSVEELLAFSKIADSEENELCGEDQSCREELFFSRFESEEMRYQALEMLKEGRFWVTEVNPTEETVKVLYFDKDEMLNRWGVGETQPLEFIFIAWFDNINGQIGNYNHNLPIEPQFSDDLHLMYANNAESFSTDGFPANTPFVLPINKTNLIEDHLGRLYIATFGKNYNSKGYLDYSDCFSDYQEGETCKLMFSPGNGYKYFPSRNNNIENEQNENHDEEETIEETTIPNESISQEITENNNERSIMLKAPNTGSYTNVCEKTIEFPWWLGILIIIGNLTCLWLFFPKKTRKKY